MSFDDWMLALHVLSAFALVAGLVLVWVLIVALRRADTPGAVIGIGRVAGVGARAIGLGMIGTIALGVWLALSVGGYDIWDPWIVGAVVLWLAAGALGSRADAVHRAVVAKAQELRAAGREERDPELVAIIRSRSGLAYHAAATAVVLLILIDMLWKPGT